MMDIEGYIKLAGRIAVIVLCSFVALKILRDIQPITAELYYNPNKTGVFPHGPH